MVIYNVTVKVEHSIKAEWLKWMKDVHVPDVMATDLFEDSQIRRLLIDEEDGVTFSIQYRCRDMNAFDRYQKEYAPALQREHSEKYKDKYVAFRTLMEEV